MTKSVWSWIVRELPGKKLLGLVTCINANVEAKKKIKIKGLTDLNKIKGDQFKIFRKRLENELLKPANIELMLNFFRLQEINMTDEDKKYFEKISDQNIEEAYETLTSDNELDWFDVFIYLLIKNEHIEKASLLYAKLLETGALVTYENKSLTENDKDNENIKKNNNDSIKLELLNNKANSDNKHLTEQNKQLSNEMKALKGEIKSSGKSIEKLQSIINKLKKDELKQEREIENKRNEISNRDKKIIMLKEELEKAQKQSEKLFETINQLNVELCELKNQMQLIEENVVSKGTEASKIAKNILLLDRKIPKISEDSVFQITLINLDQIDDPLHKNSFDNADEIWFVKFKVPLLKQTALIEEYGERVYSFNSYKELKGYYS